MNFKNSIIIKSYKDSQYTTIYLFSSSKNDYWLCSVRDFCWISRIDSDVMTQIYFSYFNILDESPAGEYLAYKEEYDKAKQMARQYVGLL